MTVTLVLVTSSIKYREQVLNKLTQILEWRHSGLMVSALVSG